METPDRYTLFCGGDLLAAASVSGSRGLDPGAGVLLFCARSSGPDQLLVKPKGPKVPMGIVQRIDLNYPWRDDLETLAIQFFVGAGTIGGNWDADDRNDAPDDGTYNAQARGGRW